jgi:hypothetical protein
MSAATVAAEQWPGWAKALIIGQFALILAVLVPWILMWTSCAWMGMGMGDMQRMMELMPRR